MAGASTHVIVVGNEKGGSGKSTIAFHLAICLLQQGYRVASIDADSRQQTFTHFVRNRRQWAQTHDLDLTHTTHYHLPLTRGDSIRENQQLEFELFTRAVAEVETESDFLVVDTPGFDTNLTRLAHSLADTLVTPMNDSLIDLDVIAHVDPLTAQPRELSHYARLVQRARSERMNIDGHTIDWVLVRNRVAALASRNTRLVQYNVDQVALRLGARVADGIAERVIFRSLFSMGLTVFDKLDEEALGGLSTASHESARTEYQQLVDILHLPHRVGAEEGLPDDPVDEPQDSAAGSSA